MLRQKNLNLFPLLCLSALAACQQVETVPQPTNVEAPAAEQPSPVPEPPPEAKAPPKTKTAATYSEAINLASGALTLAQQATSIDDWNLIVGRWDYAIEKLEAVTSDDPNYATAQTKLADYEQHLSKAKQRLQALQQPPPEIPAVARPAPAQTPIVAVAENTLIPIIERRAGTPVIEVSINGRPYPMILDTGASHTHLPRAMANELGLQIKGQVSVATASNSSALVDVGRVDSIQVGNLQRTNLPVSIGDAIPIGLLGNDVYQDYDVVIQSNAIEFRPR